MSSSTIAATRIVVERYDESLKQIAHLKRENLALKEIIHVNEIKTMNLIEHYNAEIDALTKFTNDLKDELCERDQLELSKRQRNFRDQSTWIEEEEIKSKDNALVAVIYALEDEIQALKDGEQNRARAFELKALENEANIKKSFVQDIDAFRNQISSSVCNEVRGALADTVADNQRLALQYRILLQEMEKIQVSRDEKDIELRKVKRHYELLKHAHQLTKRQMNHTQDRGNAHVEHTDQFERDTSQANDVSGREEKAQTDSGLEDCFKKCLQLAHRSMSPTSRNDEDFLANYS
jgi:hypothetical protein